MATGRQFPAGYLAVPLVWIALAAAPVSGQWLDDFDDYDAGDPILGYGEWADWNQAGLVDADITDEYAFSDPNSLRLRTDSDMVVVYSGFDQGVWIARTMVYIPSDHTGQTWYILLNQYSHNGAQNWSTQVIFENGRVSSSGGSGFGGSGSLPWITDEWVELEVEIDLDLNAQLIRYGGEFLDETPWQIGGINEIQAIDLYSAGGSFAYFDDVSFTPVEIGPRAVRTITVEGECPDIDPIAVAIQQPIEDGADPQELVTVTEIVSGDLGAAQITATNGGTATDIAAEGMTSQGFIQSWLLLGPFTGHTGGATPTCEEMQRDFLTDGDQEELEVEPVDGEEIDTEFFGAAASTGITGPANLNPAGIPTWNAHYDTNDTINFAAEYYGSESIDNVMMYAFAYVTVEEDVAVDLCVGSDDSIQVIIDGLEALCVSISRPWGAANECQNTEPYGTLQAGEHTVMVKVFEGGSGHGFRLAFKAAGTSDPAPGISVCLVPGADPCEFPPVGATITWEVTREQLASGIGYTVDLDQGQADIRGDVEGLRTIGDGSILVCPTPTDAQGFITGSQFVALGPFNHGFGCGPDQAELLLGNQIANATIETEFPSPGDTIDYDPTVAVTTGYVGPTDDDGNPVWRTFDDGTEDGTQDLNLGLGNLDFVMGWMVTYVEYLGDEPVDINVCIGTDDGGQLWWDCDLLANVRTCQGLGACNVGTIPITVEPGVHRIAAGAWDNDGGWALSLRLLEADAFTPIVAGNPDWAFLGRVRPPADRFPGGVIPCQPSTGTQFRRGDANADGDLNITDGIFVLNYLFLGGATPPCLEAANPNNDLELNITDGIYVLNYLFLGGPAPVDPGDQSCGLDPDEKGSAGDLGCESFPPCG